MDQALAKEMGKDLSWIEISVSHLAYNAARYEGLPPDFGHAAGIGVLVQRGGKQGGHDKAKNTRPTVQARHDRWRQDAATIRRNDPAKKLPEIARDLAKGYRQGREKTERYLAHWRTIYKVLITSQ
jgi:hypothetical protein